jgi:hypothetical protein
VAIPREPPIWTWPQSAGRQLRTTVCVNRRSDVNRFGGAALYAWFTEGLEGARAWRAGCPRYYFTFVVQGVLFHHRHHRGESAIGHPRLQRSLMNKRPGLRPQAIPLARWQTPRQL